MDWLSRWMRRARILFHRDAAEREMDEEMRFHLEMEEADLLRRGLPADEARRGARVAFGGVERFKEEGRDARGVRAVEDLIMDLRYGFRSLRRSPAFALAAILTLALGIGANAAIFSVVDSVLMRPLPYREPGQLVAVWRDSMPQGVYATLAERSRTLQALAGYTVGSSFSLTGDGEPERLEGSRVTAGLFELLGAEATLGRTFEPGEDKPGAELVVVLSQGLWQQRYGGDPGVLGRRVSLDGLTRTVVGVMPAWFQFPDRTARLWVPTTLDPSYRPGYWGNGILDLVGRLRAGVSLAEADRELRELRPAVRDAFPWKMPDEFGSLIAGAVPLQQAVVGGLGKTLLVLLAAVGLVLLIACANVANLLLARMGSRRGEVAVRAAVGASRERLVRQLLTEGMLLSAIGGGFGVLLANGVMSLLVAALPASTPRLDEIGVDGRVLGFAFLLSLLTGVGFGLLPALRSASGDLHASLKEGGRSRSARRRLPGALVSAEVALAVVLVIGAGLLVRSLRALEHVDTGFHSESVLTLRLSPPEASYRETARKTGFYREVRERISALPGVQAVGAVSRIPLDGQFGGLPLSIETHPVPPGGNPPLADEWMITPGYLEAMGIRLVSGRDITEADRDGAEPVALVNETLARRFWPDGSAVGRRIKPVWWKTWVTVVGVVADVKDFGFAYHESGRNFGLNREGRLEVYRAFEQDAYTAALSLAVKSSSEPRTLTEQIRGVVHGVDPEVPLSGVLPMERIVASALDEPRVAMLLLSTFATLALLLGGVGIYGVIAYGVSERTHEIGIRMALGATRSDVLWLVLGEGALVAGIGVLIGLAGALVFSWMLSSLLYGVGVGDPATFLGVGASLMAVSLLATYLPARRATRIDPMMALRMD
jgi:putative ABC transport system permease protein